MKAAIIGAGYAGKNYYAKALDALKIPVAGVYNRGRENGERLAQEMNTKWFGDYGELLCKARPDTIFIATVTATHLPFIRQAAQSGVRQIFCEKPAGLDLEQAEEINKLCREYGLVLRIGYKMRFESIFAQAKKLLDDGVLGELREITLNYYQTIPYSDWYLEYGVLNETLVHIIDLANWFTGAAPQSLLCTKGYRGGEAGEDCASVFIQYEKDIRVNLSGGWIHDYPYICGRKNILLQIVGTNGYLCGIRPDRLLLCGAEGQRTIELQANDPIEAEILDFQALLEKEDSIGATIGDAVKVHRILSAAKTPCEATTI